ncbi:MAG: DEAD/DEAH box helicase, partial [Armatimonadia bacterium]|nr:DEAD/DEAH box helicase [Armatimonadia bacterium]
MRIESLEAFGMPPVVLAALMERYGEELLPVQERAVRELDILGGGDGLVAAPTSAGKTLVAELAVLKAVVGGGRAIIVLPTRALVEDKVADLEDAYEGIGLRVVAGTRERREHEWALRRRDYDVAVVVYEKLASLLVSVPDYLDGVALVVLDELQTLSDPVRGWHAQWVLHCLSEVRGYGGTPQLLGLTADLGGAPGLAGQLGVAKVTDDVRPVPLRVGVLQGGVFHYRAAPDRPWERETWLHDSPADEWDEPDDVRRGQMRAAAAELLDRGRRVMCFLPSKHECHALARDLAEELEAGDPPVLRRLAQLPETTAAARLAPLLARGIGVHHGDLPGELRAVVEEAARAGELRCLVATTTLASGVNLPVDVVLVDPRRWTPGERGWVADRVSRSEFEAMAGRAGRLGPGERPERGDAALVAATALEAQGLMETYFDDRGGPEPAELDPAGLPLW